jgi:hypothetical protein
MNKLFYAISWLSILGALFLISLLTYWVVVPQHPIEFHPSVHPVLTNQVKSGGFISYKVNFCKKGNIVPIISKAFVDGVVYGIPDTIFESFDEGCGEAVIQTYIPRNLPHGTYYIKINYRYQINPIRTVDVTSRTELFEVVE